MRRMANKWIHYRYVFAFLGLFGMSCVYAMRVNLNVAIVSMVNHTAVHVTTKPSNCPAASNYFIETEPLQDGPIVWSPVTQGIVLGSFFWGYIFTPIVGGLCAEKYGAKWIYGGSILVCGVTGMLIPIVTYQFGYVGLVVLRVFQGFCEGVTYPAMHNLMSLWIPKNERSTTVSIVHLGTYIGVIVGMQSSGALAASSVLGGWPSIFYLSGIVVIIWFILWAILASNKPSENKFMSQQEISFIEDEIEHVLQSERRTPWKGILTSKSAWALHCAVFGSLYVRTMLITELPTYFGTVLKFDIKSNGLYSSLPYVGAAVSAIIAGPLSDLAITRRWCSRTAVRRTINTLGNMSAAVFLWTIVPAAGCDGILNLILFVTAGSLAGLTLACQGPIAIDMAPDFAGTIFGISITIGSFSGVIVPNVTGLLTEHENSTKNWNYSFIITGIVAVVSGLIFLFFAEAEVQPWALSRDESETKKRERSRAQNNGQFQEIFYGIDDSKL